MIFKSYLPHAFGYIDQSSITKFPGIDFNPRFSEIIKTSPFPELPGAPQIPSLTDSHIPRTWPELPEIIRTSPPAIPNLPEYPKSWEFDPKDTENFLTRTITDPIHNWLKGTTKGDIIKFVFENAYDTYEIITDILDVLKAQAEGYNPNDIFHNTSASENFNGGFGNDTGIYEGKRDDYLISTTQDPAGNHSEYIVLQNNGNGNATDTLIDIERLEFADGHSNVGVIGYSEIFYPLI